MIRAWLLSILLAGGFAAAAGPDAPRALAQREREVQPLRVKALSGQSPLTSLEQFALDTGKVIIRPAQLRLDDLWLLAPVGLGTLYAIRYDHLIYQTLRYHSPDPVIAGQRLSYYGSYLGLGAVDLGVILAFGVIPDKKARRTCLEGVEALTATAVVSRVLKLAVREQRPSYDAYRKHFNGPMSADSFPSGHAMSAFATAAVIATEYPQVAPLAYGLAMYLGVARVQQSSHWMSDVLIGGAIGTLFGVGAVELRRKVAIEPEVSPEYKGLAVAVVTP